MSKKEDKWVRVNISKILFDKVDKDAKETGRISGARVVNDLMYQLVKEKGL